jgi:hypothetical protein
VADRDPTLGQLFDDLTALHEELSPDTGSEETQGRAQAYLKDNEKPIRQCFRLWTELGEQGRIQLLRLHRQLDEAAAYDGFLSVAEGALEAALDEGPLARPITDDDVNMIRRVVNYAARSPDAGS